VVPEADGAAAERDGEPTPADGQRPAETIPAGVPAAAASGAAPAADPWSGLLQAGMALLQQFASAAQAGVGSPPADGARPAGPAAALVKRDERTGETYLKLPVPSPEIIDQALRVVGSLLEGLRR
jgi:hypothetical protein